MDKSEATESTGVLTLDPVGMNEVWIENSGSTVVRLQHRSTGVWVDLSPGSKVKTENHMQWNGIVDGPGGEVRIG